jgi:hypothetical protein
MKAFSFVILFFATVFFTTRGDAQPIADSFTYPVFPMGSGATEYRVQPPGDYEALNPDTGKIHLAQDFNRNDGNDFGKAVFSVANGRVVWLRRVTTKDSWGNVVIIEHRLPNGQKVWSLYAHLKDLWVGLDETVEYGQMIGTIEDANGYYVPPASGPHLHFELRVRKDIPCVSCLPQNPWVFPNDPVRANYTHPSKFIDAHRSSRTTRFSAAGTYWFQNASVVYMSETGFERGGLRYTAAEAVKNLLVGDLLWTYFPSFYWCSSPVYPTASAVIIANLPLCLRTMTTDVAMTVFLSSFQSLNLSDVQGIVDMAEFSKGDTRFSGIKGSSFILNANWDTNWELRQLAFWFRGSETAAYYFAQATLKQDRRVRYVSLYDPDLGRWTNWYSSSALLIP